MIKFFRREFGPYFRDFSEYDFKFFKTLRDVILRPSKVIEANDGTYTGELKFAFNVFTVMFIIYYITDPSWIEDLGAYQLWKYSLPHQYYLALENGIQEDYYGYIQAIAFIPLYFICLKLLFYRKKPWGFFLSASFYLSSLICGLMIGLLTFINWIYPEAGGLAALLLLLTVSIYPVISLRIQHWFVSGLKGVVATAIPFLAISIFLENVLSNLATNILANEPVIVMQSSDDLVLYQTILPIESGFMQQAIMKDSKSIYALSFSELIKYQNGNIVWRKALYDWHSKYMNLLSNDLLLISCFHEDDRGEMYELVMTLYSPDGDTLMNHRMPYQMKSKEVSTLAISDESFKAFIEGQELYFKKVNAEWKLDALKSFSNPGISYSYTPLDSVNSIRTVIKRGEIHISEMAIEKVMGDSVVWNQNLFKKHSPFDPLDLLYTYADTRNDVSFTHYTLAQDSSYVIHLSAFNNSDGSKIWQNSFSLPVDVSEFGKLKGDDDYLYLFGESHKFYSDWFWQPTYHIGLIVKIDKRSGAYLSHVFIGPDDRWGSHSTVIDLISSGDTLHFVSHDMLREQIASEDVDDLLIKGIKRDF